jgi:N-hydroxyarylamine O-acetyltransferase
MDAEVRAAYLRRLGLEAEPPSVDALQRLHRRQVERVPYETMWIHMRESWGIDPMDSAQRIALDGRGGYCFHLNGAFSELLDALGYAVTRHVGGVHGQDGPDAGSLTNHLVLTVSGLPTSDHPSGVWYVDVGLGDALHEALPLTEDVYHQPPFRLALDRTSDGVGDWHVTHDPAGSFAGMSWRAAPASITEFEGRHAWLSTSPESGFVRVATAQRRDGTGVFVLRGLVVSRVGEGTAPSDALTERDEWFAVLGDVFGLRFDGVPAEMLDALWERTLTGHLAWDAAGRP